MSTAPLIDPTRPQFESSMSLTVQKARYGISYLRNICAQSGVPLTETEPDEDVMAVDCSVNFYEADVRVQVKCTSQYELANDRNLRWPIEEGWIRKWDRSFLPVYFVLVIVPEDSHTWLDHPDDGTMHLTAAYWRRIEPDQLVSSISILRTQRLTVDTMKVWHTDLMSVCYPDGAA